MDDVPADGRITPWPQQSALGPNLIGNCKKKKEASSSRKPPEVTLTWSLFWRSRGQGEPLCNSPLGFHSCGFSKQKQKQRENWENFLQKILTSLPKHSCDAVWGSIWRRAMNQEPPAPMARRTVKIAAQMPVHSRKPRKFEMSCFVINYFKKLLAKLQVFRTIPRFTAFRTSQNWPILSPDQGRQLTRGSA